MRVSSIEFVNKTKKYAHLNKNTSKEKQKISSNELGDKRAAISMYNRVCSHICIWIWQFSWLRAQYNIFFFSSCQAALHVNCTIETEWYWRTYGTAEIETKISLLRESRGIFIQNAKNHHKICIWCRWNFLKMKKVSNFHDFFNFYSIFVYGISSFGGILFGSLTNYLSNGMYVIDIE